MIKEKFNIDELIKKAGNEAEALIEDIILAMQVACLDVVTMARSLPSLPATERNKPHQPNYIDDTGYLRSSIGYAIYNNGICISQNYEPGTNGEGAAGGMEAAKRTANQVAAKYTTGIVAVVVCGADYAAAVESKGYDVLTGSSKEMQKIFKTYMEKVKAAHGL